MTDRQIRIAITADSRAAQTSMRDAGREAGRLRDSLSQAGRTATTAVSAVDAVGRSATIAGRGLGTLGAQATRAGGGLRGAARDVVDLDGVVGRLGAGLLAAGAAAVGLGRIVQTNITFDRLEASLEAVTGSSRAAQAAMADLTALARSTPYQLSELTDAYAKLTAYGLNPSMAAMEAYGNTASAMGKSLDQWAEAVADATQGEFERLKEFGIKASAEGDKVRLTFRGVTTEVERSAADIEGYLRRLGQVEFAGGMARQADTLGGALSNLEDSFDNLARAIGKEGGVNAMLRAMADETGRAANAWAGLIRGQRASLWGLKLGTPTPMQGLVEERDALLAQRQDAERMATGANAWRTWGLTSTKARADIDARLNAINEQIMEWERAISEPVGPPATPPPAVAGRAAKSVEETTKGLKVGFVILQGYQQKAGELAASYAAAIQKATGADRDRLLAQSREAQQALASGLVDDLKGLEKGSEAASNRAAEAGRKAWNAAQEAAADGAKRAAAAVESAEALSMARLDAQREAGAMSAAAYDQGRIDSIDRVLAARLTALDAEIAAESQARDKDAAGRIAHESQIRDLEAQRTEVVDDAERQRLAIRRESAKRERDLREGLEDQLADLQTAAIEDAATRERAALEQTQARRRRDNEAALAGNLDLLARLEAAERSALERRMAEADPMAQVFADVASQIHSGFTDMFEALFDKTSDGFADMGEQIRRTFVRLLAQMATLAIAQPVIVPVVQALGGAMGVSSSQQAAVLQQMGIPAGAASAMGGVGQIGGIASGVSSVTGGLGSAASWLGAAGTSVASGAALSGVATGWGLAASNIGAAGYLGSAGANLALAGSSLSSGAVGTAIGAAAPYLLPLLAIGALASKLGGPRAHPADMLTFTGGDAVSGLAGTRAYKHMDGSLSSQLQEGLTGLSSSLAALFGGRAQVPGASLGRYGINDGRYMANGEQVADLDAVTDAFVERWLAVADASGSAGDELLALLNEAQAVGEGLPETVARLSSASSALAALAEPGETAADTAVRVADGLAALRRNGDGLDSTLARLAQTISTGEAALAGIDNAMAALDGTTSAAARASKQAREAVDDLWAALGDTTDLQDRITLEAQLSAAVQARYQEEMTTLNAIRQALADQRDTVAGLAQTWGGLAASVQKQIGELRPTEHESPGDAAIRVAALAFNAASLSAGVAQTQAAAAASRAQATDYAANRTQWLSAYLPADNDYQYPSRAAWKAHSLATESASTGAVLDQYRANAVALADAAAAASESQAAWTAAAADEIDRLVEGIDLWLDAQRAAADALEAQAETQRQAAEAARALASASLAAADALDSRRDSYRQQNQSPAATIAEMRAQVAALASEATLTTTAERRQAIASELDTAGTALLDLGRQTYASGQTYQDLLAEVDTAWRDTAAMVRSDVAQANRVADAADTLATLYADTAATGRTAAETAALAALDQIAAALAPVSAALQAQDDALSAADQALQDAIESTGQSTVQELRTIRDLLAANLAVLGVDGSHAGGLSAVPWDGYRAELHRGEAVVDADAIAAARAGDWSALAGYGVAPPPPTLSAPAATKAALATGPGGDPDALADALARAMSRLPAGTVRLTVVAPDGRELVGEVVAELGRRSRRGELVVDARGVGRGR